jgi:hypothetical protein
MLTVIYIGRQFQELSGGRMAKFYTLDGRPLRLGTLQALIVNSQDVYVRSATAQELQKCRQRLFDLLSGSHEGKEKIDEAGATTASTRAA